MPFKVSVTDYSPKFATYLKQGFNQNMFKHLIGMLDSLAYAYQSAWIAYAYGSMTVPGSKTLHSTGPYAQSIQIDSSMPFTRIIFTDYPPHQYIERGHPDIDLKPGLLGGPKARHGKHGPYNVVSFRHYTSPDIPGVGNPKGYVPKRKDVMPLNIQRMMKATTDKADREYAAGNSNTPGRSRVLVASARPQNRLYQWGARLDRSLQTGRRIRPKGQYSWKSGKYASMVRMDSPSGPKENRTQYRTFRIVSWKSDPKSWIVPAADPIPIRQAVIDFVDRTVDVAEGISNAMMADLV